MNKDIEYDAYIVLVPHGVRLINMAVVDCPCDECYVISSPENSIKIIVEMQGEKLGFTD